MISDREKTLLQTLASSFRKFGSNIAIETARDAITYYELDRITEHLASRLRHEFTAAELQAKPIAILMTRSIEYYVALISVLRAGGFFLPIDPQQPVDRIAFLLRDSEARLAMVRGKASNQVPATVKLMEIEASQWLDLDFNAPCDSRPSSVNVSSEVGVRESDFAYMIYTSGSTGRPKGVPIQHASIWSLCNWWSNQFGIAEEDRCLQMCSLGFDASLEEIFSTLVTGGCLVPAQEEQPISISGFLEFIEQRQITVLHLPTAFWHTLAAGLSTGGSPSRPVLPSSVRTVVFGGEQVDDHQVQAWFSNVSNEVRLINAYGPTEATIASSYTILAPGESPSIGCPIAGVSFYVVDEDGSLVESGQAGELFIAGAGVATEYWRREELSAQKFVDCSFHRDGKCYRTGDRVRVRDDGNYMFLGRVDDQIKLRGYRIEPGEISHSLGAHPQVSQAFVTTCQLSNAQHLVGYVVLRSDGFSSQSHREVESQMKDFLRQRLPAYMVPTRIVLMKSFPVTPGGKLDRDKFPVPVTNQHTKDDVLPQSVTEQITAQIWQNILGTTSIGRQDNFFEIGGDSLSAMKLVLSLEAEFSGPPIPVSTLIPNPTIRSMAAFLDQRQLEASTSSNTTDKSQPLLVRLGDADREVTTVCLHAAGGGGMFYRLLHQGLENSPPTLVLESGFLHGEGPVVLDQQSITAIAQEYVDCVVKYGCDEELTLVGYSLGGLLAFEMANLLNRQGIRVAKIVNIDAPNPEAIRPRSVLARIWKRCTTSATLRQRIAHLRMSWRRRRKVKKIRQRRKLGLGPPMEMRPLALELEYQKIANRYSPSPSDVTMHLIRGVDEDVKFSVPADYGWSSKVAELVVARIPGGHDSIFLDPQLKHLNSAFGAAIKTFPNGAPKRHW